jgi:hypothetical protein
MTTASELNRLLLFCGHSEMADFLTDSPLNRYLYKHFLNILPQHQIETPMVSLFNEIYYQAVRVDYDATPGVNIGDRYLRDTEVQLQSQPAAQLVYSVVWVLLHQKPTLSFNEECFLAQLKPIVLSSDFYDFADRLRVEMYSRQLLVPSTFPTITCPIDGLPNFILREEPDPDIPNLVKVILHSDDYQTEFRNWKAYSDAWIAVTGRFSHEAIERLVQLYKTPADQIRLVEMIQNACPREDLNNHIRYLSELIGRIRTGRIVAKKQGTTVVTDKRIEMNVDVPPISAPLSINISIPTAHQVNINPNNVNNNAADNSSQS